MLTATVPEQTYLDDLKKLDPLEAALQAQREYNAVLAEMNFAKERRTFTRDRLIADLEKRGRDRDGNADGGVSLKKELKNKVTDYEALIEYVYSLDEPVSTYLREVFRVGNKSQGIEDPLDRLVAKAVTRALAEGKTVHECLPPGLDIRSVSSIRVTLKKPKAENGLTDNEKLMARIDGELQSG